MVIDSAVDNPELEIHYYSITSAGFSTMLLENVNKGRISPYLGDFPDVIDIVNELFDGVNNVLN